MPSSPSIRSIFFCVNIKMFLPYPEIFSRPPFNGYPW
jgi:hypothetical protein